MRRRNLTDVPEAWRLAGKLDSLGLLAGGIAYALAMGFLGGIFPAVGAVRTPITVGLRQV